MTTYSVFVKPGSSQEKIVEATDGELTVYLHAGAHDGEANTALVKLLSRHFHVPKTSIAITRGTHSRHKVVELPGQ